MYFRPAPDVGSGQRSRLDWVLDPTQGGKPKWQRFVDVERTERTPLSAQNRKIVETHWASCNAQLEHFPDFMGAFRHAGFAATQAIAEQIEAHDPGKHEMIPLPRVWSSQSNARCERPYVFINVIEHVKTVNLARSQIERMTVHATGKEFISLQALVPEDCVVYPDAGEGRHLWFDEATKVMFMSAQLRDAISPLGEKGVYYTGCVADVH